MCNLVISLRFCWISSRNCTTVIDADGKSITTHCVNCPLAKHAQSDGAYISTLLFVTPTASVSSCCCWWFLSCFSIARMYDCTQAMNQLHSRYESATQCGQSTHARRSSLGGENLTSSMALTHGPHFHALLLEEPSAAGTVRTPQPSHRGARGMASLHFASSGREARRP